METIEIELQGKKYRLNAETAIKYGILKPVYEPKKVGQRFTIILPVSGIEDECILAEVAPNQVCLISLEAGNRLTEMIQVEDPHCIQEQEWKKICGMCVESV